MICSSDVACAVDERHHGGPGFEPRQSERQLRKQEERDPDHLQGVPLLHEQVALPIRERLWIGDERKQLPANDDDVQADVQRHEQDRQPDGFPKSLQKDRPEHPDQQERDANGVLDPVRHERVLDDVRRRVRGRERNGDDVVRGGKPEQTEHEDLAAPPGQEVLQHGEAALSVRAEGGDPVVDRQRPEQREQHQHHRREWREVARSDERDAGLVAECGEVVHAREAHDLPPWRGVDCVCAEPEESRWPTSSHRRRDTPRR